MYEVVHMGLKHNDKANSSFSNARGKGRGCCIPWRLGLLTVTGSEREAANQCEKIAYQSLCGSIYVMKNSQTIDGTDVVGWEVRRQVKGA